MLSFGYAHWPWENCQENCFVFFIFFSNLRWPMNHMLLSWTASPICSKGATHPGHMLITFWCDPDITFLRGLHKKIGDITVFFYIIINVFWLLNLCGASGDVSFAPQANLVIGCSYIHCDANEKRKRKTSFVMCLFFANRRNGLNDFLTK